ncbi:unnamed protein product [Leptidea sinapis]|uniref:Metalloendopeptidase n=1 Tax=Leptidea sinapis TaxID=189913 RepID=A0A5E4QJJ3_9NEOP|nr:unnamed protein product [Leptidea sinapis]
MTLCRSAFSCTVSATLIVALCVSFEVNSIERREEPHQYTIQELISNIYESKASNDLGMDPCKAGNFQGDIAIPDNDFYKHSNSPPSTSKINKSFQEEVERLKKEVLLEGLQVEEEGLPDILRKRTKQPLLLSQDKPKKYNEVSIASKVLPAGLDKSVLMKNGKIPPGEHFDSLESQSPLNQTNQNTPTDNLTESESLEQDGVLVVNISTDNILNLDELFPNIHISNSSKEEEVKNKIQSNSREITGDSNNNNNIRFKELPENVTVAPAPTNGVLSTNEQEDDKQIKSNNLINNISQEVKPDINKSNDLLKPTETLQSVIEETTTHKRRRRRRHGYSRRLRNTQSIERYRERSLRQSEEDTEKMHHNRKKFFRHQKKYNENDYKKIEIPEHEFEEKFEVKPPPKFHIEVNETQQFKGWFFRDSEDDLEAAETTNRKERIWENGVIPYEIDGNFSGAHKSLFKQAMRHWENFTCVKFVERDADIHRDYIVFTERPCGCCSFVGKRGNGAQAISIGKNCDKFGIVVHELGHVVGFWHEHTRPDRDRHVQIIRDNIMNGQEYNFNKLTEEEVNSLGQTYDYDSIMHYARNTFSKGTYLDTILPLEVHGKKRPEIGQRIRLSASDIAQTNLLYKCAKCGKTFLGNAGWFNSPGWGTETAPANTDKCEWRIVATHGERVVLNITEIDIHKSDGCRTEWVEVRDGYMPNAPLLGRICGSGKGPMMRSTGSRLTVVYQPGPRPKPHRGFRAYYEVRDGNTTDSPLIGMFCGHKIPPDIRSTSNKLLVIFESDSSVQKAGFSATFMKEFDECASIDHGCSHSCVNTLGGYECACDIGYELHSDGKKCEMAPPQHRITLNFTHFDLEGSNNMYHQPKPSRFISLAQRLRLAIFNNAWSSHQHLYSHPRYGHDSYESRANCDWSIVAPYGQFVRLTFLTFELEPEANCGYDYVQVLGGLEGSAGDYGSFCGTKGFSASYTAVKPEVWSGEDSSEGEDEDEEEDEEIPPLLTKHKNLLTN